MTRKCFSLLLAIGLLLCFLTACPVEEPPEPTGPKPPNLPLYETYTAVLTGVGGQTLDSRGVMEYEAVLSWDLMEDVNDDLLPTKTFSFGGVEYDAVLRWGNYRSSSYWELNKETWQEYYERYKDDPQHTVKVYYETVDGKLRFFVYHDAQVKKIATTEYLSPVQPTLRQKDYVNKAILLLETMVDDVSLYEYQADLSDISCIVSFTKHIDGYPTADGARFCFNGDGTLDWVDCTSLNRIKDTENVEYDLARGEEVVAAAMDAMIANDERVIESFPYTIQFEEFAVLKNGQLALQYHVEHSYVGTNSIGGNRIGTLYTICVPI
ncbi:MAG: hypothetical protein IJ012_07510 [Clostridia bacterium]|nr:hypothetical protein [Clostridia bacterium]